MPYCFEKKIKILKSWPTQIGAIPLTFNPETTMQLLTVISEMGAGGRAIPILRAINNYGIKNVAEFLGQVAHETGGFKIFTENLNYSVEGLLATFSRSRISLADAQRLGRTPNRKADQFGIGEALYGAHTAKGKELGNQSAGDGFNFRGRGDIQITGRSNYRDASRFIFNDERLVQNPDLVLDPEVSAAVAAWYWISRGINAMGTDVLRISRTINLGNPNAKGTPAGLADRQVKTEQARRLLSSPDFHERG